MALKEIKLSSDEQSNYTAMSNKTSWRIVQISDNVFHGEYTEDSGSTFTAVLRGKTIEQVEREIDHTVDKYTKFLTSFPEAVNVVKDFTRPSRK